MRIKMITNHEELTAGATYDVGLGRGRSLCKAGLAEPDGAYAESSVAAVTADPDAQPTAKPRRRPSRRKPAAKKK